MLHLKYLTYCLLGLSLCGCTQHVIKTNAAASPAERMINGQNALYETPSYDYRGQFKVAVQPAENGSAKTLQRHEYALDQALKQKVDSYLQAQGIHLAGQEKQALYQAIAVQAARPDKSYASQRADKFADIAANILNDIQFSYDGSVHYRERIGSFNLTARYEKPTLLVQAKLPMILDFKDYKFYTNYFAFMPYLVNLENQNNLAYIDFSKYQGFFKNIDMKKFAEYLKASGAVPYTLASPEQFRRLPVSSADQAAGVVEKIQLSGTVEELLMQVSLYDKVNSQYLTRSVLGLKEESLDKWAESTGEELAKKAARTSSTVSVSEEAHEASRELYRLIATKLYGPESESSVDIAAGAVQAAADDTETQTYADPANTDTVASASQEDEHELLSQQQCRDLQASRKMVAYGDVNYCLQYNHVDVLSGVQTDSLNQLLQAQQKLEKVFAVYDKNQFIDAQNFKSLWLNHKAEIDAALPPLQKRNPVKIDFGLDAQGRVVKVDYDINYLVENLKRNINFRFDMQVLNYGKGTPINRQQLKQARSLTEVSQGSLLEKLVGRLGKSLEQDGSVNQTSEAAPLSWNQQLEQLAAQVYDQTHSYEKTFNAVFIAKFTADHPEYVKHYSSQDLKEIGSVYAFWYADEEVYNPQGQALANLEALENRHHLQAEEQFDDKLGYEVDRIVMQAIGQTGDRQRWQDLKKKYRQPQQLFSAQYQYLFDKQEHISSTEKAALAQTSNILARAFSDAHQQKLSETSLQGLNEQHEAYIDYELFEKVYQQVLSGK